jgi:hypothetical protein
MRRNDDGWDGDDLWVCSRQAHHILADPEHWTVDVIALGPDAVDMDGDPVYGMTRAERLSAEQLRIIVGMSESTESES